MDKNHWDERYRSGGYTPREYPSDLLSENVDWFPDGRALDLATGTGRNALFLAEQGYTVDAVDISEEALATARENADKRDVDVTWVQADLSEYDVPAETYDIVNVSFYYDLNLLAELKEALTPGGVLVYEHHLRPASLPDRGPSSDQYRFRSNDLLQACLDLTVLDYRERMRVFERGERAGQTAAIASIIARKPLDDCDTYPPESDPET